MCNETEVLDYLQLTNQFIAQYLLDVISGTLQVHLQRHLVISGE